MTPVIRMVLFRAVVVLVVVYGFLAAYAWFGSDRALFQPHPASYRDTSQILKLTTETGKRISAVHLQNPSAQYTLLVSHGNAEDIGDDQPWLEELRSAGFNVFAYDYEGYGTSEGTPNEDACYEDEQAAYDYLTQTVKLSADRIIIYGRSVGSGPAVRIAARKPVAGLVLQSPFSSAFRVVTRVTLLPFDRFPNYKDIHNVRVPILIMHGTADEVIGFRHGVSLYNQANEPKRHLWVNGAGHNDFNEVGRSVYLEALRAFAASLALPAKTQ